jgi:hypothetical protein
VIRSNPQKAISHLFGLTAPRPATDGLPRLKPSVSGKPSKWAGMFFEFFVFGLCELHPVRPKLLCHDRPRTCLLVLAQVALRSLQGYLFSDRDPRADLVERGGTRFCVERARPFEGPVKVLAL